MNDPSAPMNQHFEEVNTLRQRLLELEQSNHQYQQRVEQLTQQLAEERAARQQAEDRLLEQAEVSLRESEDRLKIANERFQLAARAVSCLIYDWYLEPDRVERTDGLTKLLGYSLEEAEPTGRWWRDRIHPDDLQLMTAQLSGRLMQDDYFTGEYRVLNKANQYIDVLDQCLVVERDADGKPVRIVGSTTDISDRKRAQLQLQESQRFIQQIADSLPGTLYVYDLLEQRNVYVNRQIGELLGYTPEQIQTLGEQLFPQLMHPEDFANLGNQVERLNQAEDSKVIDHEYRMRHANGEWRWLWSRNTVSTRMPDGRAHQVVGTVHDITNRKQVEAEREQLLQREQAAREQAEAANRVKDEFLAVLSHELRTPLNPILGWAKLLRSHQLDLAATDRALETIERNAKHQAQLIEDLLDVSRILQGKVKLEAHPVNLGTIIEAALETVRLSAAAKSIPIQTELSSAGGLVNGDANRLQQIVWNLLSNAIKFTPVGGQIQVRLDYEFSAVSAQVNDSSQHAPLNPQPLQLMPRTSQSYAQITVSDTGQGITPDFLPHVFEYFRQADSTTTRHFGGLGLGLAIARHLVELHGGTVKAESPGCGMGATFVVKLPLLNL